MSPTHRISFGGCDYLGLARDGRVLEAARRGLERELSTAASPVTTGLRPEHGKLESALAETLGTPAAALLPAGALANLAACEALAAEGRRRTWIDPRSHPSLAWSARAAGLEITQEGPRDADLILVDGVFPSRGEAPDLRELAAGLAPGGRLLVDDAHGLGVRGPAGRGSVAASFGSAPPAAVVQTLTLSKSLGSAGGAVAGDAAFVERVRASAAYVGSTSLAPALARAALSALELMESEPERRERLEHHVEAVAAALARRGRPPRPVAFPVFALEPAAGRSRADLREDLLDAGFDVPMVVYPQGVDGTRRDESLRLALSAAHTVDEVAGLAAALEQLL